MLPDKPCDGKVSTKDRRRHRGHSRCLHRVASSGSQPWFYSLTARNFTPRQYRARSSVGLRLHAVYPRGERPNVRFGSKADQRSGSNVGPLLPAKLTSSVSVDRSAYDPNPSTLNGLDLRNREISGCGEWPPQITGTQSRDTPRSAVLKSHRAGLRRLHELNVCAREPISHPFIPIAAPTMGEFMHNEGGHIAKQWWRRGRAFSISQR